MNETLCSSIGIEHRMRAGFAVIFPRWIALVIHPSGLEPLSFDHLVRDYFLQFVSPVLFELHIARKTLWFMELSHRFVLECDKFKAEAMVTRHHDNGQEEIPNQNPQLGMTGFPKTVYRGALDLLVDAIQLAATSALGGEGEHFYHRKPVKNPPHLPNEVNNKPFFIHRGVPISQKRVVRRAKNVYKSRTYISSHIMLPVRKLGSLEVDSKRAEFEQELHGKSGEEEGNGTESHFSNRDFKVVGDDDMKPLVRSKRGRSQILPSKYNDSVLQPWKRGTRMKKEVQ